MSFAHRHVDPGPPQNIPEVPADLEELLIGIRRHLHRFPEIGFEEHQTYAFVRGLLEKHGLHVRGPLAGTGLYVDVVGDDGPSVGYRADIDALPAQDAKETEYASLNPGAAHLCGHDAHTAIAVGTALLLHRRRESLHGTVRVFFQPNEEGNPGGAVDMIRDGVLDGLEAVYAAHVDPTLEAGRYGLLSGPATAATDRFRIVIRGRSGGHSARPHETVDTIWMATQVANTMYQLAGRITDARNPAVLTICRFHAGEAYNVIPAEVEMGGTLRSMNADDRDALLLRIDESAKQVVALHGGIVEVEVNRGSPPVINDPRLIAHLETVIRDIHGEEAVYRVPRPSMGADDFAHYVERIPGALLRVGTSSGPSTSYPLHDAHFDIDESALISASRLMAQALAAHLEQEIFS